MSTASSMKGKQLPVHSVSIEIYSGIALFPCDSAALVYYGVSSDTHTRFVLFVVYLHV